MHCGANKQWVCRVFSLATIVALLYGTAWAADFAQRKELGRSSKARGLGRPDVELLIRQQGPGRKAVANKLLKRFGSSKSAITTGGPSQTAKKQKFDAIEGSGWSLQVFGDGTEVRYRNYQALDSKLKLQRPVSQRLGDAKLEQLGRKFIAQHLQDVIQLGPNEALVPFKTEHAITTSGAAKEGARPDPEKVAASAMVFSRTVNGVHILGGGSKVAIIFANDETPVGFDLDWPMYKLAGKKQKVLSIDKIRGRAKKLAPRGKAAKVQRLECGYFDAGGRKRDQKAFVQAAAAYHVREMRIIDQEAYKKDPNSGWVLEAAVEFIPAGATVEKDMRWSQAAKLRGEQVSRRGSPARDRAASKKGGKP